MTLYAHEFSVIVGLAGIITATVRHYFNQKHLGFHKKPRYLVEAIPTVRHHRRRQKI
jgi:uncharacterized membrane protein